MARTAKKEKALTPEEKLAQALVPDVEQPYRVPKNWCWIHLLDSFDNRTDSKKKIQQKNYLEEGTLAIVDQSQEVVGGYSNDDEMRYTGTLPVIIFGDHTRCIKYIDFPFAQGADGVKVLAPKECFLPKAFFYALRNIDIPNMGYRRHYPLFKDYSIPVPPFSEQQRIVDRIESLFAKLDEAKEKAQAVVDGFEDRRAAILHKAFTGELTEEWRTRNTPPSALTYLKKIQESENCFSRKEFKFWTNDNLPNGWAESKIGNLLYYAGRIGWKGLKAEEYTDEGPLLLSVYNLNDGDEVTYHRVYHITEERYEESPEIMVQMGDVLLTKDGAGIGKLGYVKDLPQKATINSSLLLIRPANAALPKYIYYTLLGPNLQRIVKERITGSATPHLFQRDIKEFVIPVPSLEEQQQIVDFLDVILAKLQKSKEIAEQLIDQIDAMKKSILARAFRGELGTNDPADMNALEVIRQAL